MFTRKEKDRIVQALHLLKKEKWKQYDERNRHTMVPDFEPSKHKALMNSLDNIYNQIDEIKNLIVKINRLPEDE